MGKSKYEATIDQLRSLANGSLRGAVDDAGKAAKRMHGLTGSGIDHTALSAIPSCVQFQKVLSDAMATYAEVAKGIEEDVAKFHDALHKTANTMQNDDESAAAGIAAIAKKINGPLATRQRGEQAYKKHHSLHNGKASDAPQLPQPAAPAGQSNGSSPTPSSSTSASAPAGTSTTYDAKTGNPVPTSSTSAGAPSSSPNASPTPSAAPSATPTPSATPSASPSPTPSTGAGTPPG